MSQIFMHLIVVIIDTLGPLENKERDERENSSEGIAGNDDQYKKVSKLISIQNL